MIRAKIYLIGYRK